MVDNTSIKVSKSTREKLRSLAKYGDSMDSVILECLEALKVKEKRKG